MTALVTGGAGFIGRHLIEQLRQAGVAVRCLDRRVPPDAPGVDVIRGDITDADAVLAAMRDCSRVYHLAGNPQLWTADPRDFHRVHVLGSRNVFEAARRLGVERVLHTSTESILTRARQRSPIREDQVVPAREVIGPYCRSKYHAENEALRRGRAGEPIVVVNPTLPVGPGDWQRTPPTQMMLDFCLGKRPAYLDAQLNLIDVRDVAAGMVRAMEVGRPARRYLLGAENWSIRSIFTFLAERTGLPAPRWRVPYWVALGTAWASEAWANWVSRRIPAATITGVKLTRRTMHFDPSRSLQELGLAPRPVAAALEQALGWFAEQNWLPPIASPPARAGQ